MIRYKYLEKELEALMFEKLIPVSMVGRRQVSIQRE